MVRTCNGILFGIKKKWASKTFTGGADAGAEAPVLWPPDSKS